MKLNELINNGWEIISEKEYNNNCNKYNYISISTPANPDLFRISEYCRENGVIPNITINGYGLTNELAVNLSKVMGAVAVSRYTPPDYCYDAVKKLTDLGMKQINIHMLLANETYDDCIQAIKDIKTDPRLTKLNAIVFLSLKPKGKRNVYTILKDKVKFKALLDLAMSENINVGFDSCSANKVFEATNDPRFKIFIEPCESTAYSLYCNVEGKMFPCSFSEGIEEGIDLLNIPDFLDVWMGDKVKNWRNKILTSAGGKCRKCYLYNLGD